MGKRSAWVPADPGIGALTIIQLVLTHIICNIQPVASLPCSYQNPRVEDVLFEVPIGYTSSKDKHRKIRSTIPTKFHSLRIHLHYDDSVLELEPEKQLYINSSLLPEAAGFWERALRVRRAEGPIKLRRKCLTQHYYFRPDQKTVACELGCKEQTTCGEAFIPPEHLLECQFCSNPDACATLGSAGEGVEGADFILYVAAKHTKRCENADTLAYAAHCQQEQTYDRPIAGHVNLCPSALSTQSHDQELLISTVKHEMVHALGFSAGLFAFFRDEQGRPRTKRNRYGKPLHLNAESGYYEWDESTIAKIPRPDWWTSQGNLLHEVTMMVTPRVRDEARKHFGCPSLEGAELENQGGEGTALTHWEKRLFENEAMTGTHTQNPVYSRLTLALLEDSGWYRPNYDVAESLYWGQDLGCDFVKKSCGDWIRQRKDGNSGAYPFCEHIKHDGKKSLAVTRCTSQRDSLALCNLVPYKKELPKVEVREEIHDVNWLKIKKALMVLWRYTVTRPAALICIARGPKGGVEKSVVSPNTWLDVICIHVQTARSMLVLRAPKSCTPATALGRKYKFDRCEVAGYVKVF
ncbi:unnamed protein product, partial [Mesorhabditis spiculigera]